MERLILDQIRNSCEVKNIICNDRELITLIKETCDVIISAYKKGNRTLIAGNGGSAADAQHIAAEFVSRFYFDRPGLSSIALTTDSSILTAIGNDYGYERVFARQIEAHGIRGDVFIAISTSGNSRNIIEALKTCKKKGIITIGFTNKTGGNMSRYCDFCIRIPATETPRIQEAHILIGHIICYIVEKYLFRNESNN